jgi:hypothetical protein
MCVRRRRDCTRVPVAAECREVRPLPRAITTRTAHCAYKGDLGCGAAERGDNDYIVVPVAHLVVVNQICWLRCVVHQIWRPFRVRAGGEAAAVLEQDRFGVVKTVDCDVSEPGEAGIKRGGRVVEDGVVVRFAGKAEAGEALHCTVEYKVRSVREGGHAGDDAF